MRLRELNVGCFGGGTGLPSLLGGLKSNPWVDANAVVTMFDSGGSSGRPARRAGRAAAGRHPEVRPRALAERARGAPRAARAPADARARQARRTHRRQSAAVDDAALQRRLPRCDRWAARAARLPRPRLAGQRPAGVGVRGIRRRIDDARRGGGGCRSVIRPSGQADLARAAGRHPPGRRPGDWRVRRRDDRSRQLLHEPDADLPGRRRLRSAAEHEGADHPDCEPPHRGTRHGRLHRRRCGGADRGGHSAAGRRGDHQHEAAGDEDPEPLRARAQGAARAGQPAGSLRGGRRRLLDRRDRPPRSPAARLCRVERSRRGGCCRRRARSTTRRLGR